MIFILLLDIRFHIAPLSDCSWILPTSIILIRVDKDMYFLFNSKWITDECTKLYDIYKCIYIFDCY